jgi:hypothetical protein
MLEERPGSLSQPLPDSVVFSTTDLRPTVVRTVLAAAARTPLTAPVLSPDEIRASMAAEREARAVSAVRLAGDENSYVTYYHELNAIGLAVAVWFPLSGPTSGRTFLRLTVRGGKPADSVDLPLDLLPQLDELLQAAADHARRDRQPLNATEARVKVALAWPEGDGS